MSITIKIYKDNENNFIKSYEQNLNIKIIDFKNILLKDFFPDYNYLELYNITERIYKDYGLLFFEKGLLPDTIDHYELNKFTISNRIFSFLIKAKNVEKKKNLQKPRYFDTNRYRNNNNNNNNKNEFVFNEDDFPTL